MMGRESRLFLHLNPFERAIHDIPHMNILICVPTHGYQTLPEMRKAIAADGVMFATT
jgi:hypothetical protein